jgi:putative tryptophan/tyrosine transport system substrate-binding protein
MRRREFIAGTAATALAGFAQPSCAQTSARPGVKGLAIFHPTDRPEEITSNANRVYKAYFDELKKHGYTEGQNLVVERYSALGHPDRIGDLAREIVANHPDVVLPLSGVFLKEFMALHSFIPMVGPTADPVAFEVASNLARPDKQFTGVVLEAGLEIWPKRFQLLLETARKMTKLGFLDANPLAGIRVGVQSSAIWSDPADSCAKPRRELEFPWLLSSSPGSLIEKCSQLSKALRFSVPLSSLAN